MAQDYMTLGSPSDKPPIHFKTRADLDKFVETEVNFNREIVGELEQYLPDQIKQGRAFLQLAFKALRNEALDDADQRIRSGLSSYLESNWPHPGTVERQLLETLDDQLVRRAAFYILYGHQNPSSQFPALKWQIASFAVAAFHFGLNLKGKPLFRDVAKAQDADHKRRLAALDHAASEREQDYSTRSIALTTKMAALETQAERRIIAFRRLRRRAVARARADIQAVHATYQEQMRLQEPVKYWSQKGLEHSRQAKKWLWATAGAAACVLGMPAIAWAVADVIGLVPQRPLFGWPSAGAIGWADILRNAKALSFVLLASGLTIWGLRFCARVYLSERHLATDANERSTIVMTYLALLKENAASEAERAIVLQTLFRSSADGIVRDDSGMDPSIAGLLAKLMDRPSAMTGR